MTKTDNFDERKAAAVCAAVLIFAALTAVGSALLPKWRDGIVTTETVSETAETTAIFETDTETYTETDTDTETEADTETYTETESETVTETAPETTEKPVTTASVTTAGPKETEPKIPFTAPIIGGIPYISQKPGFPNGCESVSTVMALQAAGIDVTPAQFVADYLDMGPLMKNGIGPDPSEVYVGDPRKSTGWGCNSPVIENALKKMDLDGYVFGRTDGMTLEELCRNYVDNGVPVVIWAAVNMNSKGIFHKWKTADGKLISYYSYFHCVLLVGSDETHYYIYDPLKKGSDGEWTAYKKSNVKKVFDIMGQQSIVVYKDGTPGVPDIPAPSETETAQTTDLPETTDTPDTGETVGTEETVETVDTAETVDTVETAETDKTVETFEAG